MSTPNVEILSEQSGLGRAGERSVRCLLPEPIPGKGRRKKVGILSHNAPPKGTGGLRLSKIPLSTSLSDLLFRAWLSQVKASALQPWEEVCCFFVLGFIKV